MAYRMKKAQRSLQDYIAFTFMNVGLKDKSRMKGTIVRFGFGEERFGIITKVVPKGVYVQEYREPSYKEGIGLVPIGKPFFVRQERFRKYLGEAGAVGTEPFKAYPVLS